MTLPLTYSDPHLSSDIAPLLPFFHWVLVPGDIDMGVLKLKVPGLCLLLLMPLLLLPGSEAETCTEWSKTYTTFYCTIDPCAQHCHDEGFDNAECRMISFNPIMIRCFCKKPC